MNKNNQMIIYLIILLFVHRLNCDFNPNRNDYDAYGLKIGMNDILFVEAQNGNNPPRFLIQFSPYKSSSSSSLKCSIYYPSSKHHYVYTVALAKNQTQFFFAGELINGQNGTFIGVAKYNSTSLTCNTSFSYFLQYFYNYEHQEYYVIDVEPNGRFAYGFSNKFIYIFDSKNNSILKLWDGNLIWPDSSFMPHAVDLAKNFGVISGFIRNPTNPVAKHIPIIYLINLNSANNFPIIIDQYIPNTTSHTWQDTLTNSDANIYSAKYDMSININTNGNILIGMQFINRVFLFFVNIKNPIRLNYISRHTNGRSLGNGKGVTWLDNGIAAILVNTYTLHYHWLSSKIYFYDIKNNGYNSSSIPLSVFPNHHQLLPLNFSPIFLNIISSSSLSLLDNEGNILILNPTSPGFYPSMENIGSMPIYSSPEPCLPGTYKNQTGIHDCILCPTGTKNPGNSSLKCISCLLDSFCPLGSVSDICKSSLQTIMQVRPYPKSPESTIFDEILIQNMFSIGSGRCLVVSPLFWTLIVGSLSIIMIIIMGILKICTGHPRSKRTRYRLKCLFKHTDLINEGESWIGGLASFCVIILVSFAYSFSNSFLKQYPLEKTSASYFACDLSLRNAKFQTNIQSLSIPITESEQEMFNLLNNQILYLNIDLINTLIDCDVISLEALYGTIWSTIRWTTCINNNSILSLSIQLPYQHISVKVVLDDIKTIGGLRIGLYGNEYESEHYYLKELNFYQSFSKSGHILAQSLPIDLDITKIINETLPMIGEESDFSGIYIPTFTADPNSLFLSKNQYVFSTLTLTTLTINIVETPYYVQNIQQPIAKSSEIIFHNLLFTIVCLEIFGLAFLLYKLGIKPLCYLLFPKQFPKNNKKKFNKMTIHVNKIEEEASPV